MPGILLYWIMFINDGYPELIMIEGWKISGDYSRLHCCCHVSTGQHNL